MPDPADCPGKVLRFDRAFEAPPPLVYALWTRPELVSVWFAVSGGWRAHVEELDPRPGGAWSFRLTKPGAKGRSFGTYHEAVPGRRLAYSYFYDDEELRSFVSVDLEEQGQGTRMRFCQTGFPDAGWFEGHNDGWAQVWKMFGEVLGKAHGLGSWLPPFPPKQVDGVARDLEAARERYEAERRGE